LLIVKKLDKCLLFKKLVVSLLRRYDTENIKYNSPPRNVKYNGGIFLLGGKVTLAVKEKCVTSGFLTKRNGGTKE
jgi:hypothetical protein